MSIPVPRSIEVPATVPVTIKSKSSVMTVPVPARFFIVSVSLRVSLAPDAMVRSVVSEATLLIASAPAFSVRPPAVKLLMTRSSTALFTVSVPVPRLIFVPVISPLSVKSKFSVFTVPVL